MNIQTWIEKKSFDVNSIIETAKLNLSNIRLLAPVESTVSVYTVCRGAFGPAEQIIAAKDYFNIAPASGIQDLGEEWDSIDSTSSNIANYITEIARKDFSMTGRFFFSHNESDGDYDLFYTEEIEEEALYA